MTWSSPAEISVVVLAPRHLRKTLPIALVVGSAFVAMNQLGVILSGQATGLVWLKVALTYLTPLAVSNYGVLSATRRHTTGPSTRTNKMEKSDVNTKTHHGSGRAVADVRREAKP
jgi:hypothetical protein